MVHKAFKDIEKDMAEQEKMNLAFVKGDISKTTMKKIDRGDE